MEKKTIVRSLFYKFTERFAVKGIGFVISLILARLLAPELFGQIVVITAFSDLSMTLIDCGLSTALVQNREVSEQDYATVFYITIVLAAVMIALMYSLSPLIARYYRSPEIIRPLRFYAFSLLLSACNSVQVSRMQREMRFRDMMFCNLAATLISGSICIYLACRGAGLWALVIYSFAQIAVTCIAMAIVLRWFPHGSFSTDSAKRLCGYGLKIMAASIITTLYNNLRPLIIGRRFSTADLGYYDRGQKFASTASMNLDAAVQSVMFPVLSRSQNDPEKLRSLLRHMKKLGAFLIFPVMFGMAAAAKPMVQLLLTDTWLPAVPFVVLLSIAEAQVPLTSSNLVLVKSTGRSDIYARQEVLRRLLMLIVLAFSVLAFRTVRAIAVGFLLSAWLDVYVTSISVKKLIGYSFADQFRDIWKTGLSAVLMAGAAYTCGRLPLPPLQKLVLQAVFGIAVYLILNLLLKNESLVYLLTVLKQKNSA